MTTSDLWVGGVWEARRWLWEWSSLRSVRNCGRSMRDPYVTVKSQGRGHVRTMGTQRCSSVWACPMCSRRIMRQRQGELVQVLGRWESCTFGTLTMPHRLGHDLKARRLVLQAAWKEATKHLRRDFGPWRYVRVLEATPGRDRLGHPHFHVIVDRPEVARELQRRWLRALPGASERAQHLRAGDAAGAVAYLTQEAFGAWTKASAHWSVLRAAVERGDGAEWRSVEQGLRGARQVVMSRGLLKEAGIDEVLDQDVPDEPLEEFVLDTLGRCAWMRLRARPALLSDALGAWADWDWRAVDEALEVVGARRYSGEVHAPECSCDSL